MKLSLAGEKKITRFEADKLVAYLDSAGVWTIGKGWTGLVRGQRIHKGMRITQAESDALFKQGLAPYEASVNSMLPVTPTPQRVYDMQVSLAWNIGFMGYRKSGAGLYLKTIGTFNTETITQLGTLMKRYNKIRRKGALVVSQGLVNRRAAEVAYMLGSNTRPMTTKEKIAAGGGAVATTTVVVDQVRDVVPVDNTGTLQSIVDTVGVFGMSGSTVLATLGSIVVVGVLGYIVYSKFAKAPSGEVAE